MFRDLGRVHIVSFAVGIVGLIIGITGIVLAIVFGTSQPTCATPVPPTPCPQQITLPCNTNLFSISTTVNGMKYDADHFGNPSDPVTIAAVNNITDSLTASLNAGLNTQSSSAFLRILAAETGPTSNNVKLQITQLGQDENGFVIAIGNGAISAAANISTMPTAVNVQNVIDSQNTTYSAAKTTPQACNTTVCPTLVCPTSTPVECTTLPAQTTNSPLPTNPPSSSGTTATQPATTVTQAITTTTQPTSTITQPGTTATSQKATSATVANTSPQVTTQTTPGQTVTSQSTAATQTVVTTVTTPGSQSTATVPAETTTQTVPITTTQGITNTNTPVASTLTTAPPLTTQTTQGSPTTPGTSTIPITSTKAVSSSSPAVSTTTQPNRTTTGQPTSQTQTPNPSTATVPVTSTTAPGTSTAPPTIGPNQCYYQSNVAVAFELADPTADIDIKIQDFIANTLLFYPGNPYQLGNAQSSMTKLALVPFPTDVQLVDMMSYGDATDKQRIQTIFFNLGIFAKPDAEINQSLDFISTLPHTGSPGFVIIVGNNGTSVASSMASSQALQQLGFSVITVGYNSTADFSPLASSQGYSFKIGQNSDELSVAQQIGNILNSTYCLSTTVSPTAPVTTATTVGVQSTSTASSGITSTIASTVTSTVTSAATSPVTSSKAPITSTLPSIQSSTSLPTTATNPPITSTSSIITSTIPLSSSSSPLQTTSSAQVTSTTLPGTSTAQPTLAPGQCYYQSNVAVAFELISETSDVDLEIETFIQNNLFFYGGAPYQLGQPNDGKTELSLVPYPNDGLLKDLMTYGSTYSSATIKSAMDLFNQLSNFPDGRNATISDAFNLIPTNSRQGPPGFVILIGNTDTFVQSSVASANNLKNLGFKIITVAFKSSGKFSDLSSDPSYNFQIHQDADQNSVAMSIGNILNSTFCTPVGSTTVGSTVTPGGQTSTVTVPQAPSSSVASTLTNPSTAPPTSSAPSSTVTIPSTPSASSSSMSQSRSTASYTTTPGSSTSTAPGSTSQPPQQSSSSPSQQSTTQAGSSPTVQQTTTNMGSSSSPSQQSTTPGGSTSSPVQQSTTQGGSTSFSSPQSSTPAGSTSSPSQQSTTPAASTSSPSQQSSSIGSSSSPSQQTTTQSMSSSSYGTSVGITGSTPGASSSSPAQQSTTPSASSSTVTVPSTIPTSSGTPAPTTSQICPNQQTVFNGQVGVIYEMLPASDQQNTINDFVENILLNTNFYGLAVDNLKNENRTLATAIPYPSTSQYAVQGYGSARSVSAFKNQVIAFNAAIKPTTANSDISDALLYVSSNLQAGSLNSSLIIVGNSQKMIDQTAGILADQLKDQQKFDIYTVSVGDNAADLSSLSSGNGFSFTGNTQQVADQIGLKMANSNPAVYCPPPIPSTSAPSTSTVTFSSTVPVTTPVPTTTRFTTVRPTVGPCQCTGRWVYNGDLAIAFEYIKASDGSTSVVNFITNTLLSNPASYGLSSDVNGNQASQLTIVPYPDSSDYPIYPYGSIRSPADIGNFVDAYSGIQSSSPDPSISTAFDYINANLKNTSNTRVVLLVGSDGSDVTSSTNSATKLKNAGYTVITVAQTAAATVFQPLSSGSQFAFHIGDGNDNDVANKISNLLLDISFTCFDDGSSTPSPITRCPGTQGTTQPGVSSTSAAPVTSTSTAANTASSTGTVQTTQGSSSTTPSGSSSTVGPTSTVVQGSSSTVAGSTSTAANIGSTMVSGSSSSVGSTVSVASTSTAVNTASTTIGSTVSSGSSTMGSSTAMNTASTTMPVSSSTVPNTASTTIGSTVSQGSSTMYTGSTSAQPPASSTSVSSGSTTAGSTVTTAQPSSSSQGSTAVNTGSTTIGSTVTQGSSTAINTASTTIGSTVTQGSSTAVNTGSTTAPVQSSSVGSTSGSTQSFSSTTAAPLCANPFNGKLVTVFELNSNQAEIQSVVDFVSNNLYNSANYDFSGVTQAINVPYGDTDNQNVVQILNFGDAKSLSDLQSNIATLYYNAPLASSSSAQVADGLDWFIANRDPDGTSGIIIVVGYQDDSNYGLTTGDLYTLRQQGYKVFTVSIGSNLPTFGDIADKPEWYFQVNSSNGQSIANQISYILCNL
ncbi:unnamed protein product [Caenorhabditis brenneri]